MDALAHTIEAYVASARYPFTDPLAMEAVMIVDNHLLSNIMLRYVQLDMVLYRRD
jgi:alcohol dehydrogenase class IV